MTTHMFMVYDKKQIVGWCVLYVYISVKTKTSVYIWKWGYERTYLVPEGFLLGTAMSRLGGEVREGRLAFSSCIIVFFHLVQKSEHSL